jgi:hypothetical protein
MNKMNDVASLAKVVVARAFKVTINTEITVDYCIRFPKEIILCNKKQCSCLTNSTFSLLFNGVTNENKERREENS